MANGIDRCGLLSFLGRPMRRGQVVWTSVSFFVTPMRATCRQLNAMIAYVKFVLVTDQKKIDYKQENEENFALCTYVSAR